jgi:hypothetical protein
MSRKRSKREGGLEAVIMPLRVPGDVRQTVKALAEKARLSEADILRMAIDRGLSSVEKMFEPAKQAA